MRSSIQRTLLLLWGWIGIMGAFTTLSITFLEAADILWGVNSSSQIYIRTNMASNPRGQDWQNIPGGLVQVATTPQGKLFGVNGARDVFARIGISPTNPAGIDWRKIGSHCRDLIIGPRGEVVVVSTDDDRGIYYRNAARAEQEKGSSKKET